MTAENQPLKIELLAYISLLIVVYTNGKSNVYTATVMQKLA